MRKMDLVHIHTLGIEIAEYVAEDSNCEISELFDAYSDVDVSGPHDVRAQKATQQEAVFALLGDILMAIDDEEPDEEESKQEAAPLTVA